METQGEVKGDLGGTFHYTENATVNWTTMWGTNQGFITMDITDGCPHGPGTIYARFRGRVQVDMGEGVMIIDSQPFTILQGEGGCEGIHGQGTRSAVVSLIPLSPFAVTYRVRVHWDPQ